MMLANSSAAAGYAQTAKSVGTPRTIEYQVFQRVTAKLRAAKERPKDMARRAEAVAMNTKLWVTLMTDLASDTNELPDQLRAQLISLGEFSRKHGTLASSENAALDPLIDVNTAVMRGLRGVIQETGQGAS